MRIIATIPHPDIHISVFQFNDKYIVKLEAGPMEQSFKFTTEEVNGAEDIRKLMDGEFMRKALERFKEMFLAYKEAKERFERSDRLA